MGQGDLGLWTPSPPLVRKKGLKPTVFSRIQRIFTNLFGIIASRNGQIYPLPSFIVCFIAFLDVSQCNESLLVDGESEEAMFVLPHISWKRPTQGDLDFQVWG